MAPENRGHHVDPGEHAVLARAVRGRLRAAGLHVAAANASGAAELLLHGTGCLRVGRRSLRRGAGVVVVPRVIPLPLPMLA